MAVNGTIVSVVPSGGYQSRNGYISKFQMTVQDSTGKSITGEIGSKSGVYPLVPGQPIMVEVTNTSHGVRLKKINAGYEQPQGPQQAPSRLASAQNRTNVDWDDIAKSKIRDTIVCALIKAGHSIEKKDAQWIIDLTHFVKEGTWPGSKIPAANPAMGDSHYPENEEWVGDNPPPPAEDDIPF